MFKNRVLSKIFESKLDEVAESFMICIDVRMLLG